MTKAEHIEAKAERVLGVDSRDLGRLLRAIAAGEWTPDDARRLKESSLKAKAELERMWSVS